MKYMVKTSESAPCTPETVLEVKKAYNRLLDRSRKASDFISNPEIPQSERDKYILTFRIELLDPMEAYLRVLEAWNIEVSNEEIANGFKV